MTQRILLIIPTLVYGGAEKQMVMLATGLPNAQFDVHVCVLTHDGPLGAQLEAHGIEYHVIKKTWKADPAAYLRLKRHIRKLNPDIVHTWLFAANSFGRFAAHQLGIKQIFGGERCVDPWKRWHELAIDRYLARRSTKIVTNSTGVRDFYVGKGIAEDKFEVIANGIEIPKQSDATKREEILKELNLPENARLIGAVGRLWPQKRVKDLIWAADLLKCVRDDIHLLIIGDGPHRWRLERFRNQVEIQDRVHFLGERSDARAIISELDCLWLGSEYEGQSNVVMEAMASGTPVIATDIPGMRDLVVPDETGLLVHVGDRTAFAKQTRVLLDDESMQRMFREKSIARIQQNFSVEQMIESHVELYQHEIQ